MFYHYIALAILSKCYCCLICFAKLCYCSYDFVLVMFSACRRGFVTTSMLLLAVILSECLCCDGYPVLSAVFCHYFSVAMFCYKVIVSYFLVFYQMKLNVGIFCIWVNVDNYVLSCNNTFFLKSPCFLLSYVLSFCCRQLCFVDVFFS